MPRAVPVQTNFTAGEVSPRLRGRVDLNKYFNGAERLKNFIVKPQGGIFSRTGTIFVCEVKDSSKTTILLEFEFSDVQSYLIEIGHQYIRFIKDRARIESPPGTPVEIASAYQESELEYLQFAQSADVVYITHPSHKTMMLSRLSDTSWSLDEYEHFDGPYLPQNATDTTMVVTNMVHRASLNNTVSEFAGGDVGNFVEYTRFGTPVIAKVMANVSGAVNTIRPLQNIIAPIDATAVLSEAVGVVTSTVAVFSNSNVGSYIKVTGDWFLITGFTDTTHVTVGAALTMVTTTGELTFSDETVVADVRSTVDTFVASDVGRHIRFNFSAEQVWGTIATYVDAKNVTVNLDRPVPLKVRDPSTLIDDGRTTLWRLGAWSESTGYPSCVTFHEERLCFSATPTQPCTTWMSVSGEYDNHAPTDEQSKVLDTSAITYTIASSKVNAIKWLSSGPTLIMGTFGSEWQVRGGANLNDPITPTNISVVPHTTYGSGKIRPIRVGSTVLFIQRNARKIRELAYDYQQDALVAKDLTIINEQILRQRVKARCVAYQQEPNSIYWVACEDGRLVGLTYVRDQEVYAWHPHELGGSYNGGYAQVRSLACISNLDGVEDELYMIVRRTINGVTKQYIEYFSPEVDPIDETDKDTLNYVDCGIPYSGAAISTRTGYSHLEGETVQIWADGAVRSPVEIVGGEFDFTTAAAKIYAGLPYESLVKNLPPEAGNPLGSAMGQVKRVDQIILRVHESMGFKFGANEDQLVQWSNRIGDAPMDSSAPLRTDDIPLKFDGPYEKAGSMVIVRDNPTPLNILALGTAFDTSTG